MWETWVPSLGQEDPLEKEMGTHSSIHAWKSHGPRSLVGYNLWGRKESDMTEQLLCVYCALSVQHLNSTFLLSFCFDFDMMDMH